MPVGKQFLALSIGSALLQAAAGKAEGVDPRCTIASLILREALSSGASKIVILSTKVQASPIADAGGIWLSPKGLAITAPPQTLVRKLKTTSLVSAIGHCSLANAITGKKVRVGPAAVDRAMLEFSQKSSDGHSLIMALSMPVISADGKSALAYYNEVSGLTAGGAYTYYLKKEKNGQWIVVGSLVGTVA